MNLDELLGLLLKLFPVMALGIYLGKIESRLDSYKERIESLEKINNSK